MTDYFREQLDIEPSGTAERCFDALAERIFMQVMRNLPPAIKVVNELGNTNGMVTPDGR